MKETKTASGTPEARAAMHEMMAAFEAFKGANDARLDEIEKKASADTLLEEKVARIDQAVSSAQARLDRVVSEGRRPELGVASPASASRSPSPFHGEEKAAFDGYLKTGASFGLELKAGLSTASNSIPAAIESLLDHALIDLDEWFRRQPRGRLSERHGRGRSGGGAMGRGVWLGCRGACRTGLSDRSREICNAWLCAVMRMP